jgi:hypothetical protein
MNSVPRAKVAELAYIAGYVDGEGCIRWSGTPNLCVETCNPSPLKFIKSTFGGTIYTRKRTGIGQTKRTVHRLAYYGDNCILILKTILPYLVEKKEQAEDLIEIRKLKQKLKSAKKQNHHK